MPIEEQVELNKRKLQFLNQNGIKVKVDGSWGPWLEGLYRKLTTKDRHYNTTPLGFLSLMYDKSFLGNGTTYLEEPSSVTGYSGELKKDDRSGARRWVDLLMKNNNTPLGYFALTILPSAAVAGSVIYGGPYAINGIRTMVSNPAAIAPTMKALTRSTIIGLAGGAAVEGASKFTTGKSFGELVAQSTGVSPEFGTLLNPGFGINKPLNNIERRAIETVMRTGPFPIPYSAISNFREMLNGHAGGKTRLAHIGNYILTGMRTGPKGYYNSFAEFTPSENASKNLVKRFFKPKGESYAYTGIGGGIPINDIETDMIDAFLYKKPLSIKDAKIKRVSSDYGVHTDYIKANYPTKDIPVYEVQNGDVPENLVNLGDWVSSDALFWKRPFESNVNNCINVGGHLIQKGTYSGSSPVYRGLDIWKFNPDEYMKRWVNNSWASPSSKLQNLIIKLGVHEVDRLGTPVITRTLWTK